MVFPPSPNPVVHPDITKHAAEVVFVGDSTHDMRSGRAAGVGTAAALWGPYTREQLEPTQPDTWLERPDDVLSLLRI